jgi:hypothetical protein
MLTYQDKPIQVQKISPEEQKKQERMRDVSVLLENLVEREQATLMLIIDCLYDVGTINIVNKKFRNQPMNRLMKAIASMTKPVLRLVALRWVKKNLPTLVTNWLERKVSFR